jgi:hypothetical protein
MEYLTQNTKYEEHRKTGLTLLKKKEKCRISRGTKYSKKKRETFTLPTCGAPRTGAGEVPPHLLF